MPHFGPRRSLDLYFIFDLHFKFKGFSWRNLTYLCLFVAIYHYSDGVMTIKSQKNTIINIFDTFDYFCRFWLNRFPGTWLKRENWFFHKVFKIDFQKPNFAYLQNKKTAFAGQYVGMDWLTKGLARFIALDLNAIHVSKT